jgi:hypothetical protein
MWRGGILGGCRTANMRARKLRGRGRCHSDVALWLCWGGGGVVVQLMLPALPDLAFIGEIVGVWPGPPAPYFDTQFGTLYPRLTALRFANSSIDGIVAALKALPRDLPLRDLHLGRFTDVWHLDALDALVAHMPTGVRRLHVERPPSASGAAIARWTARHGGTVTLYHAGDPYAGIPSPQGGELSGWEPHTTT